MATYKMRGVNKTTAKGRTYFYWRATGERLPDDEHERVMRVALLQANNDTDRTMAGLVAHYYRASNFRSLSERSQSDYRQWFNRFVEKWGKRPIISINREVVLNIGSAWAEKPGQRDKAVRHLSLLLTFALDYPSRYGLEANPAIGVRRVHRPEPYPSWPREVYEAAREFAPPHIARAIILGLNSGQRIGDVTRFAWTNWNGVGLNVRQQKTGKAVWIPASTEMRDTIEQCPRSAAVILTTETGRPWTTAYLQKLLLKVMTGAGLAGYTFHGLRKSAGYILADMGCTAHEIRAILGCTLQMAAHYTESANQKKLAQSAVVKLNEWGKSER